jgi:extracellular elastinolytic metalloproteinase
MTRLEDRTTPAAAISGLYYPPTHFFVNPDLSAPTVTGPIQPLDIGLAALSARASDFGLSPTDLVDPIVTSQYTDLDTGIHHIYLRQQVNGLAVMNAEFSLGIAANGAVISIGGAFVPDLADKVGQFHPGQKMRSPIEAVQDAARQLELSHGRLLIADGVMGPLLVPPTTYTVSAPSLSMEDIPLRLQYVPTADGSAALAWGMVIQTLDSQHWYDVSVDVATGRIVALADWMSEADYRVVPVPNESPQDGGFSVISNAADPTASPFGWHDTNGVAGAEFTDTRGNNVDSHLDRDANNVPDPSPPRPDGGANLDFSSYTFDPASAPTTVQNQNAAMVNLFFMNNILHDVHYQYGFTEAAGNFQVNNYGRGGAGNDAVQADAQDGSGTNNANFGTPVDGSANADVYLDGCQSRPRQRSRQRRDHPRIRPWRVEPPDRRTRQFQRAELHSERRHG